MAKRPHRRTSALLIVPALLLMAGCTDATPNGTPVDVALKDFSMTPALQTVRAGDIVFHISNQAPVTHEFVVVRTDLPADELPIGPDGLSVNEEWLSGMGEIDEVPATHTGT